MFYSFDSVNYPNVLYEHLKHFPIMELAPVYGRGVRGRTLSGRSNLWLLNVVCEAGVRVIIDLRTRDHTDRFDLNVSDAGLEYFHIPIDSRATDVHEIIFVLPKLFALIDQGNFYMACAMGLHRTDIALALYYVFHPSVPFSDVPEMRGHRDINKQTFRCDDIGTRLNRIIKEITPEELFNLGLSGNYDEEFLKRKKRLFDVNRMF